jgi:saccharopine dehydrogenase-like NADP-dependent oxidoreductase
MQQILVIGAGRSSSSLIEYLIHYAPHEDWEVVVGDVSLAAAEARVGRSPRAKAVFFDIDSEGTYEMINSASVVISLLPPFLHPKIAAVCLELRKHLFTASYVSEEMKHFHDGAKGAGLLFLNECGLDPGIDHMSAMQLIDRIKERGGVITSFESFTGGLIAPNTDSDNPWRYKFTWNPRNVVMAGQGTAKFIQEGQFKYIPYQQLFKRITPVVVPGFGDYEGYVNRDSLKYISTYGLEGIQTMVRGTLRNSGFCGAWNVLVQLGCCDDSYNMDGVHDMTHAQFLSAFLPSPLTSSLEVALASHLGLKPNGPELARLKWSGFFEDEKIGLTVGTPAQALEHILNKKWQLHPQDKDLVVMWHRLRFEINSRPQVLEASLVSVGQNGTQTAMAKTVGLPLGIATRLFLKGKITHRGVAIPVTREFYDPILAELQQYGIVLSENEP